MSALWPNRCTTTIALGSRPALARSPSACSSTSGSRFQLVRSLSRKTGVAPRYRMGLTDATKVSVGENTSSPGPTPRRRRPRCNAAVPLETATAGTPMRRANSASKASMLGPTVDSQLLAIASRT